MLVRNHPTIARALLAALVLSVVLPAPAFAAGTLATRTNTAYRLNPGRENVSVVAEVTITNRKAPSFRIGPCAPGSAQRCRIQTDYYFREWGYVYVPVGAVNLRFGPGVSQRLDKTTKYWQRYMVNFANLHFGQTRRFDVRYEIPGAKPRSAHETRVLDAYSYFCWYGQPGDSGTVTVRMPPGYKATSWYEQTKVKSGKGGTTISGIVRGKPGAFYACTDATKPAKLLRTKVSSPAGQEVIVEAWPEDPAWSELIVSAVEDVLPALEELIGEPMPLTRFTVREVTRQSLAGYGSTFGLRHAHLRLGDHIEQPSGAARGLALAWFNGRRIKEEWLQMGLSDWAGLQSAGQTCRWPGTFPGKGKPRLRMWQHLRERPTEQQQAVVDWQFDAACWVVSKAVGRVGEERMPAVIAALVNDTAKYGPQPGPALHRKRQAATWRDWLDAVDEVGLGSSAASLTLTEDDLVEYGIATRKELKGRAQVRGLYHESLAQMDGSSMPRLVDDAMGRWDWKVACKAIPLALSTYRAISARSAMPNADRQALLGDLAACRSFTSLRSLRKEAAAYEAPAAVETQAEAQP